MALLFLSVVIRPSTVVLYSGVPTYSAGPVLHFNKKYFKTYTCVTPVEMKLEPRVIRRGIYNFSTDIVEIDNEEQCRLLEN